MILTSPSNDHDKQSNFKLRIFAQSCVYFKKKIPKKETQVTESGIVLEVDNWYEEVELPQLAINYNGIYINEKNLDLALLNLNNAIKKQLIDKGCVL